MNGQGYALFLFFLAKGYSRAQTGGRRVGGNGLGSTMTSSRVTTMGLFFGTKKKESREQTKFVDHEVVVPYEE